ncbi:hypothetical protein BRC78_03800 [Halobacteriales archaeon QH_8_68_33]|jgi:hypothetical protein|nr:MAG: hypothetical protein BRC78_03800 [Halobacteriales archaeon QH_8_68_33]
MADDHDDGHGDHDGHGHGEDRPAYDPSAKDLPERAPPLRSTAPQSDYTMRDVGVGFAVLAVGLVLTFGLALGLV